MPRSFQRHHGHSGDPVIELPQPRQLTPTLPAEVQENMERQKRIGRPFQKGNKAGGKKPKLAKLGLNVNAADPQYQNCLKQAESYRRTRVREYQVNFGFVSIGVRGLLATAALQLAASRYMMDKAMEVGDMDLLKKASSIGNDARQNELAAWELCSREGRAKNDKKASDIPWVRVADEGEAEKPQGGLDATDDHENVLLTSEAEPSKQRIPHG